MIFDYILCSKCPPFLFSEITFLEVVQFDCQNWVAVQNLKEAIFSINCNQKSFQSFLWNIHRPYLIEFIDFSHWHYFYSNASHLKKPSLLRMTLYVLFQRVSESMLIAPTHSSNLLLSVWEFSSRWWLSGCWASVSRPKRSHPSVLATQQRVGEHRGKSKGPGTSTP